MDEVRWAAQASFSTFRFTGQTFLMDYLHPSNKDSAEQDLHVDVSFHLCEKTGQELSLLLIPHSTWPSVKDVLTSTRHSQTEVQGHGINQVPQQLRHLGIITQLFLQLPADE